MVRWVSGVLGLVAAGWLAMAPTPVRADGSAFLVHGNWCGSGNRALPGIGALPPLDPLDAACMRHDVCYAVRGSMNCGCDLAFMSELRHMPYPGSHLSVKARAMYDTISMLPCAGPEAMYKPMYFLGQLASDAFSGRAGPWEVPLRMGYMLSHAY
ncbi:MAG: hypothetical protein H7840_03895 [Alphaproteobacteria bacterium]